MYLRHTTHEATTQVKQAPLHSMDTVEGTK